MGAARWQLITAVRCLQATAAARLHGTRAASAAATAAAALADPTPAHPACLCTLPCSQLEDPWRLLPIQGLVDIGMKDMQA